MSKNYRPSTAVLVIQKTSTYCPKQQTFLHFKHETYSTAEQMENN